MGPTQIIHYADQAPPVRAGGAFLYCVRRFRGVPTTRLSVPEFGSMHPKDKGPLPRLRLSGLNWTGGNSLGDSPSRRDEAISQEQSIAAICVRKEDKDARDDAAIGDSEPRRRVERGIG